TSSDAHVRALPWFLYLGRMLNDSLPARRHQIILPRWDSNGRAKRANDATLRHRPLERQRKELLRHGGRRWWNRRRWSWGRRGTNRGHIAPVDLLEVRNESIDSDTVRSQAIIVVPVRPEQYPRFLQPARVRKRSPGDLVQSAPRSNPHAVLVVVH